MGIRGWHARKPLPGAKPSFNVTVFHLLDHQNHIIGLLLVEPNNSLGEISAQEAGLLEAISFALGYQLALQADLVAMDALSQLLPTTTRILIVMGESLAAQADALLNKQSDFAQLTRINTFSPAKLLAQPLLKRQLWQDWQAQRY